MEYEKRASLKWDKTQSYRDESLMAYEETSMAQLGEACSAWLKAAEDVDPKTDIPRRRICPRCLGMKEDRSRLHCKRCQKIWATPFGTPLTRGDLDERAVREGLM